MCNLKFVIFLLALLPSLTHSKQLVVLYADPIILKFSDGSSIEVNALAEVDAGTVRTHLFVNGQQVDRKSVPRGVEFTLRHNEDDISIEAKCKMPGAGMFRDPRGLEELYPVNCMLRMNGENLGKLILRNIAKPSAGNT